ncbi:aldose 1-epimerase [Brevundimonas intermedia]|uniref:Aldose 1-epimerase n=1 Tax=Brevundimonas intermedia TaxID=74315 RepID=A0ABQ5TD35_9CAUL|nr:aldose 1-epimerase [Brevundimonas intermedia]GLK50243.1 aldose 1-epimerase [Brevundimonas intermedia]
MSLLTLTAGDWRATVAPEQGGAILSLEWRGQPVFRQTPEGATDMLETACFPLVPYANRIADARFEFEGRDVRLRTLDRFAPHALHGDGWLNPWTVESVDDGSIEMVLDWSGGGDGEDWPWPWRARQVVQLTDLGLEVTLSVTNTGDAVMPAGLGLHPYFHKSADSRLSLSATGVWLTDAREIPERVAAPDAVVDWSGGLALAEAPFVDHAYAGWAGAAVMEGGGRRVILCGGAGAEWAQVYAPVGADYFCVEPVTHRPDVLNAPPSEQGGLARLLPGESLSLVMTVIAEDL